MRARGNGTWRIRAATPVDLARAVGRELARRGLTLAVAESCTGGMLGGRLTAVAGSSAYFRGGVVAYANDVKARLLGVAPALLRAHGAVSAPVALAMARGVRRRLRADLGVGITGVAGPGGGTAAKPVGLVLVAVADGRREDVATLQLRGGRDAVRRAAVRAALRQVWLWVRQTD